MVIYLLRYDEIGLKGKNRSFFEKILFKNIERLNKGIKLKKTSGRFFAEFNKKPNFKCVFGLASYSAVVKTAADIKDIAEAAISLKPKLDKFRVSCQRLDKRIPLKSINVEKEVGAILFHLRKENKVSLKDFDTEIFVELIDNSSFVFLEKIPCFSGLPVGSQSKAGILLQSAKDVLAGLFALKRGCSVLPICHGYSDTQLLEKFGADKKIDLKDLQKLDELLEKNNCLLLYSGQNFKNYFEIPSSKEVMRPLIFYSDKEMEKELTVFEKA